MICRTTGSIWKFAPRSSRLRAALPATLLASHAAALGFVIAIVASGVAGAAPTAKTARAAKPATAMAPSVATAKSHGASHKVAALVKAAQRATVAGDLVKREQLLHEALTLDPNYAPAHWLAGETNQAGEWVKVTDTLPQVSEAQRLALYRQRRASAINTAEGQLTLAKWCKENSFPQQARSHFTRVLVLSPGNPEAMAGLGLEDHQDRLMTKEQWQYWKQHAEEFAQDLERWKPEFNRIRQKLEHGAPAEREAAKAELAAIDDPAAAPALEVQLAKAKGAAGPAFIAAIARLPGSTPAQSLVRQAVINPSPRMREAATTALRPRAKVTYVPPLLAGLAEPIETSVEIETAAGGLKIRHSNIQAGEAEDHRENTDFRLAFEVPNPNYDMFIADTFQQAAASAAQAKSDAERENWSIVQRNERVLSVLKAATGEDFGSDPRDWWNWWHDQTDTFQNQERKTTDSLAAYYDYGVPYQVPVVQYELTTALSYEPPLPAPKPRPAKPAYHFQPPMVKGKPMAPPPGMHWDLTPQYSCFAKGTLVSTSTGLEPIDTIETGDLVLSQDVETGELAYKPVLERTERPERPMINLVIDGEIISATRGHLFWVVGEGWKMASELSAHDRLQGEPSIVRLTRCEGHEPGNVYNLIVADTNSYFVGEHRVLVHDNTGRKAGDGKLPGMGR